MDVRLVVEVVVALCAIAALVLSVHQEIIRRRKERPCLRVTVDVGFVVQSPFIFSDDLFITRARNIGGQTVVVVDRPGILLPNGIEVELPSGNVELPHDLLPGRMCSFSRPVRELASMLHESGFADECLLIGIYQDLTGRRFQSEPYVLDLVKWMRPPEKRD